VEYTTGTREGISPTFPHYVENREKPLDWGLMVGPSPIKTEILLASLRRRGLPSISKNKPGFSSVSNGARLTKNVDLQ
jgi:hypothetical protein